MSVTFKEYLKNNNISDMPHEHQIAAEGLLKVVNIIREKYGKPLSVSSGYRSKQKQLDIYRSKGISDDKIPMRSGHLRGLAIDFADPNGEFEAWCSANQNLLEELKLWQEQPTKTIGWVHLDLIPRETKSRPNCLKRQFNP